MTRSYEVVYSLPDEIWQRPWIKVLLIGERELLDKYEPIYRTEYDNGYAVRSGDKYLDVVYERSFKGKECLIWRKKSVLSRTKL